MAAGELLGLGLISLHTTAERSGTESCWKRKYKVERWVQAQGNAVDTVMVEMCWRAPSSVTQLGSLIERPQLAAALQAGSGICFSLSRTTLSLLLHARIWDRFTPLGIISIAAC